MSYPQYNFEPVPKKVQSIYLNRLDFFQDGGEYKTVNLPAVLDIARTDTPENVRLSVYSVPKVARPSFKKATEDLSLFKPAHKNQKFGPSWTTHWFKVDIRVPQEWHKYQEQDVIFNWDCGNEGLIFLQDGTAVIGLSGEERKEWIIPKSWQTSGQWHTFFVETSCNSMFGNSTDPRHHVPTEDRYFTLKNCDLVVPNKITRALNFDFEIIKQAAKELPKDSWQNQKALEVGNQIMTCFVHDDPESWIQCRKIAQSYLGDLVDKHEVYTAKSDDDAQVFAVGHCHIDTAWLWPYAETRRKIGRSWASQLDLIERYPEYTFGCSQAVQYEWLEQDYPDLFARLKKAVQDGRFLPVGGSWVESDGNLPNGEAIVRQFLFGQNFFQKHFGKRSNTYWLPDTFGYSAQLPQLCRKSGMQNFLTQKLSWNNINNFPNTTFNWVALDGSQVLCHMPPADTYNAFCDIGDIRKTIHNHKNLDVDNTGMMVYGFGDGGGGPTVGMLEKLRRARGMADTVGGIPKVTVHTDVEKYFERVASNTGEGKKLVTWAGELYFEFHRGTYTTQADIKRGNRFSEILLHDIEYISTLISVQDPYFKYPTAALQKLWKKVLLNQFHDVLPGSSIEIVYDDAKELYKEVMEEGAELFIEVAGALSETQALSNGLPFINTLPWARSEVISIPEEYSNRVPLSQESETKGEHYVFFQNSAKNIAEAVTDYVPEESSAHISGDNFILQNSKLRATFSRGGTLISLFDSVNDREMLLPGTKGHQLVTFDDQPLSYQGWDTEIFSLDRKFLVDDGTVEIVHRGPVRSAIKIKQKISENSSIETIASLDCESPYLEFNATVDWHESFRFLKVEFPIDIHCDYASYDTMFGVVRRPTHYNTSWDVAKFEVCCHKYADLSDYLYGVTVLNDSKYGFSVHGNVMRLSLLRSPKSPDTNADMGVHHIRYAIMGHKGQLNGEVVKTAFNFNYPLRPGLLGTPYSLKPITWKGPDNIIVSNVKRGEADHDVIIGKANHEQRTVVVRLYDALGARSRGKLMIPFTFKKAVKCNLLEDDEEELKVQSQAVQIEMGAFEVLSVKLYL